jgi:hypothetical protein
MNVPAIGGAKGLFEIFVPGVFLLLNIGLAIFLSPFVDDETKELLVLSASNPILSLVVAVSFGYPIGVILRLFRTNFPDKLSAAWHRRFSRYARNRSGGYKLYAIEEFPYIGWIEEVCKSYLPHEALDFYHNTWGELKEVGENKQYFNFSKVLISAQDERSSVEIYAAEALSRYISGMFYALSFAFLMLLTVAVIIFLQLGKIQIGLLIILLSYLFAILVIIRQFRFIRIKEVEIVFAASYKNRSLFDHKSARSEETENEKESDLMKAYQKLPNKPNAADP